MKTSLIVCSYFPLPETTGGNIRTMNFARLLRQLGEVDIAYSRRIEGSPTEMGFFRKKLFLEKKDYSRSFFGRLRAAVVGQPYPVRELSEVGKQTLGSLLNKEPYDYILIRYSQNALEFFCQPPALRKRIILDFDDIPTGSLYSLMFSQSDRFYKIAIRRLNKALLSVYLKRCLGLNISLFSSDVDHEKFCRKNDRCFVVPNVFANQAFDAFDFGDGFCKGKVLLFVGTLEYLPNAIGLKWFIRSVYPSLKRDHPDASLIVVGRMGHSDRYDIGGCCHSGADIELHTNVPDIRDYYRRCRAVVVPLWQGGGTRIKILEAIKAHRPVLSTPIGAEGLELKAGRHFLSFQDADEFVESFNRLLDEPVYFELTRNAREVVERRYRTENFNQAFDKVLSHIDRSR